LFACSETSTRGQHVKEFICDEEASGEKAGGGEFIEAAFLTVSTSKDIRIIRSSTVHYIQGAFYQTWVDAEKLGYKRYRWSLAKHVNGGDIYKTYHDTDPKNWLSNVPWTKDETIQQQRRRITSDDRWLVEILGGISIASGLVFKSTDVDACTCNECDECEPYKEGKCPLVQYYLQLEGMRQEDIPLSTRKALQFIGDRILGIDWGKIAPDCYSVVGKYKKTVFVLDFEELYGQTDDEKTDTAERLAKKWYVEIMRPDPEPPPYSNTLRDKGYTIHELWASGGQEKEEYLHVLKGLIEHHNIKIPKAFEDLIRSLKNLTYDKQGKIYKNDDHAFDSLLYAVSYYGEIEEGTFKPEGGQMGAKIWIEKREQQQLPTPSRENETNVENCTRFRNMMSGNITRDAFFCNNHLGSCISCQRWLTEYKKTEETVGGADPFATRKLFGEEEERTEEGWGGAKIW
jgi:hypothetical protein